MKNFEFSDNRMEHRDDEVQPSEAATAEAQPVVSSLDAAAVTPQAEDPVPASESVQDETPLAHYTFENKAWGGYLCIALAIGGIAIINSIGGHIGSPIFVGLTLGVALIFGYRRAAKLPVFALYNGYLEFTSDLFTSTLQIPYTDIISVDMKRKNRAKMEVRRPDGRINKKALVRFNHIKGSERDQAREQFRRKMEELGKLNATTAVNQQSKERRR